MTINFRLFASLLAFSVSFAAAAFAQSQPTPVGSRADAIVEKPLVTSETDLSGAKPQPMPSIAAPVNADAVQFAQSQKPPANNNPPVHVHDTGNPSVAPLKWVGLVMTQISKTETEIGSIDKRLAGCEQIAAKSLEDAAAGIARIPADAAIFKRKLAAILIGAAALASYLPARRATRVDPALVLRED